MQRRRPPLLLFSPCHRLSSSPSSTPRQCRANHTHHRHPSTADRPEKQEEPNATDSPTWTPDSPTPLQRCTPSAPFLRQQLDPESLTATLEAHRHRNRPLFRKVQPRSMLASREQGSAPRAARERDIAERAVKSSLGSSTTGPLGQRPLAVNADVDGLIFRLQGKSTLGAKDVKAVRAALQRLPGPRASRPAVELVPKAGQGKSNHTTKSPGAYDHSWLDPAATNVAVTDLDNRISAEIIAFAKYLMPSRAERHAAADLYKFVARIIQGTIAGAKVESHGSRTTSLASATSDIDLCVTLPMFDPKPEERGPSSSRPEAHSLGLLALRKIAAAVRKLPPVWTKEKLGFTQPLKIRALIKARVNILELHDDRTGLTIQISANAPYLAVREMTRYLVQERPRAVPIFMLLRQTLAARGLLNVSTGGIGSYPLFVMIVTALRDPDAPFTMKLAGALEQVLQFWTRADIHRQGFMAEPFLSFSKEDPAGPEKAYVSRYGPEWAEGEAARLAGAAALAGESLKARSTTPRRPRRALRAELILQDPANPNNDLGKKCIRIEEVMAAIREMTENLNAAVEKVRRDPRSQGSSLYVEGALLDAFGAFGPGELEAFQIARCQASDSLHREPALFFTRLTSRDTYPDDSGDALLKQESESTAELDFEYDSQLIELCDTGVDECDMDGEEVTGSLMPGDQDDLARRPPEVYPVKANKDICWQARQVIKLLAPERAIGRRQRT